MALPWLNTVFQFLAGGQYNQTLTALGPGQSGPVDTDAYGRLRTIPGPPVSGVSYGTTWIDGTALVKSLVLKSTPGNLLQLFGFNDSGGTIYLHVFDAATLPVNGSAPLMSFRIAAGSNFSLDLIQRARVFATGIVVAASSTPATLTLAATNVMWLNAEIV